MGIGDGLPQPSVFDTEDERAEGMSAQRHPLEPWSARRACSAHTFNDWFAALDWRALAPAACEAERALAVFAERRRMSAERVALDRLSMIEESVAEARMAGLVTTRHRVQERMLLVDEPDDGRPDRHRPFLRITPGDGRAVAHLADLKALYGKPGGLSDSALAGMLAGGDRDAGPDGLPEAERALERITEWRAGMRRELRDQPRVIGAAAGIWMLATHASDVLGDPAWVTRVAAPAALAPKACLDGDTPLLFPGGSFAHRSSAWSPDGDPAKWAQRFAEGMARAAQKASSELALLEQRVERARAAAAGRRRNSRLEALAVMIAREELLTAATIRRRFGWRITDRAVRMMLEELGEHGIVREITGRQRFRVYAHASIDDRGLVLTREPEGRTRVRRRAASVSGPAGPRGDLTPEGADIDLDALMRDADRASARAAAVRDRRSDGGSDEQTPDEVRGENDGGSVDV